MNIRNLKTKRYESILIEYGYNKEDAETIVFLANNSGMTMVEFMKRFVSYKENKKKI